MIAINRKLLLIIGTFLLIVTVMRLAWYQHHLPPDQPEAVEGIMDLREWDIPAGRSIALDGEWSFYPSQLLTTDEQTAIAPAWIQVPGPWNESFPEASSFHYGTYHLRILLDPHEERTFALRFKDVRAASEVYINGERISGQGKPASNLDEYEPVNIPYTVLSVPEDGAIDLMMHIASHIDNGGIQVPIRFGLEEAVIAQTNLSIGMQFMLCVVLLMHAGYGVVIYFLGPPSRVLLYFTLLVLSAILSVSAVDDKLLLAWLPVTEEWRMRISYLSYLGTAAFVPTLIRHLFPEYQPHRLQWWFNMLCSSLAIFILVAPESMVRPTLVSLMLWFISSKLLSWYILQKAMKNQHNVIFLLLSLVCIIVNVIWASIKDASSFDIVYYPFDLILALLGLAAFWFNRFFETNKRMKQLAEQLQRTDQQKDDFLVNTSHELRNPLHGLINIAQSIIDDDRKPIDPGHRHDLKLLITVGRRMSLLLDDLLDIKRLRDHTVRLAVGRVHLESVTAGVLEMIRFMLEGKPLRFNLAIPSTFPPVKADEHRLIQILFNLLHNAVKFTEHGVVTVRAEVKHGLAYIHVEDTGIGMEKAMQDRIFQLYEQGDVDTSHSRGGLGLGLSISKHLVELHGGTLSVDSVPGQGSIFSFTLPLAEEQDRQRENLYVSTPLISQAEDEAPLPSSIGTPTLGTRSMANILAVDDDAVNLRVIKGILSSESYSLTTVSSGAEALAQLEKMTYDLVIADVMMPSMSGYELSRTLRERFSLSELPILLLTARSHPEDIATGFRSGANDYVTKPVDAEELRARTRVLIDLKLSMEERLRMEAAWLQAQIKPHFIFNTINAIAALSSLDVNRMQSLLEAFSHYMRTSFDFHNSDKWVYLERELSLVESYVYIEQVRFGERLKVVWELKAKQQILLPPLTIQPLVENAVNHGVMQRSKGGAIWIRTRDLEGYVEISVIDDGVGIEEPTLHQLLRPETAHGMGIGFRNTDHRLRKTYGHGLRVDSVPGHGTTVSFHIPKQ